VLFRLRVLGHEQHRRPSLFDLVADQALQTFLVVLRRAGLRRVAKLNAVAYQAVRELQVLVPVQPEVLVVQADREQGIARDRCVATVEVTQHEAMGRLCQTLQVFIELAGRVARMRCVGRTRRDGHRAHDAAPRAGWMLPNVRREQPGCRLHVVVEEHHERALGQSDRLVARGSTAAVSLPGPAKPVLRVERFQHALRAVRGAVNRDDDLERGGGQRLPGQRLEQASHR
jgi:hypothetical protein